MPIVVGGNLRDRLKASPPDEEQARQWLIQMTRAAVTLHERELPIVHRDIKPSNFLVDADGTILLTDFGIAFQENQERLTRTTEQMGSTAFMSPEQAKGKGALVGPASDIYSLGVVFHEVLTGEEGPISPGKGIDGELGELIRTMTRLEPGERPTAAAVLTLLGERSRNTEEEARLEAEEEARLEAEEEARQAAEEEARQAAEEEARQAAEEEARQAAEEEARLAAEREARLTVEKEGHRSAAKLAAVNEHEHLIPMQDDESRDVERPLLNWKDEALNDIRLAGPDWRFSWYRMQFRTDIANDPNFTVKNWYDQIKEDWDC